MAPSLQIRLLGELEVSRGGRLAPLPPSRKTRALLGYLALTGRGHRRERLCDLFWDVADDPRGALRWSLSKLRALVDDARHERLVTEGESIRLDLAGASVDALEVQRALATRAASELATDELVALAGAFRGDLLEGLDLPDFDDYQAWCVAERETARRRHAHLVAALVERLADRPERALGYARTWTQLDPADERARAALLGLLGALGRRDEARQHHEAGRRLDAELGRPTPEAVLEAWRAVERGPAPVVTAAPAPPVAPRAAPAPSPTPPPGLVGRGAELAWLAELEAHVEREKRLRVLLLTGEPGVGKSHLLRAWLDAPGAGTRVALAAASFELERGRPYAPWIDAFRAAGGASAGLAGPFEPLLGGAAVPEAPAAGGRERLYDAVAAALGERFAPARAGILVFDDAQWLDDASAELLHVVARALADRPVAVVLAARAGEAADNAGLVRLVRAWRRDGRLEERALGPLDEAATAALARGVRGDIDGARVYAQSSGNPLYALELARAGAAGAGGDGDGGGGGVPDSLGGVVRDRLAQLPPDAADVLRWLAVLGRATPEDIAALSGLDGDAVLAALELCARRAIITGGEPCAFAHEVVRRVVYGDLSGARRRGMHRKVAERLAGRAAGDAAVIADVAHHAAAAQASALAARACLAAARHALRLFAGAEALALARRGLRHAEGLPEPEQTLCRLELLEARIAARRPEDPDETIVELQGLAERALDLGHPQHARLGFHLLSYLRWETGDWSEARRLMLQAEAVSRGASEPQRVLGLAEAARCLVMLERDLGHAQALALEASARGRQAGVEPPALRDALGLLRQHEGRFDEAARELERARALARAAGERYDEFQALEHLVVLDLERGAPGEALAAAGELAALAERLRDSSEAPFARALAALARVALGDDAAQPALEDALQALVIVDAKHRLAYVLTRAAWLDVERGELERGGQRAMRALGIAELLARPSEMLLARLALWRCARARGDEPAAAAQRRALAAAPLEPVTASVRALVARALEEGA
jgi:DNA-binding SARP family transcriptional activator